MIFKNFLVISIAVVITIDGKTIQSPISHDINKANISPISTDIKLNEKNNTVKIRKRNSMETNSIDFLTEFRKMRRKRPDSEMRIVGTVGLISGALKVEEAMRNNLYHLADELFATFNKSSPKENMEKLLIIEETIDRDKSSIAFLNCALKYARNLISFDEFQKDMKRILKEVRNYIF